MVTGCRSLRHAALVAVFTQAAALPLSAQGKQDYIVRFRAGTSPAVRAASVRRAGAGLGFNFARVDAAAVRVPNASVLAALRNNPSVLAVVPDREVSAIQNKFGKPSGSSASGHQVIPAGVTRVGAPHSGSDGSGIGVAVLDTGVDLAHQDLTGVVDAFDAFTGGSCRDDQGHGTHVAGTIAARDNGIDVIGVAPAATIYCVKVLDHSGSGSDATVMAGLEWVLQNHLRVEPRIRVINMSLGREGSAGDNPDLRSLVADVTEAGIAIVVAAGNNASLETSQQIPAAYPEVIAVASTTARTGSNQCRFLGSAIAADTASYFTSDGPEVAISAPGEDQENVSRGCLINSLGILSTRRGGGTTRMSGTSMAAPHVSGVVARYFQRDPGYDVDDIRSVLQAEAAADGAAPLDSPTGSYTYDGVHEGIAQAP